MYTIDAIPTRYDGTLFRSKLEAKWAAFFDATQVNWEYEPRSYHLTPDIVYTPDFWLPHLRLFIEVKPVKQNYLKLATLVQLENELIKDFDPPVYGLLVHGMKPDKDKYAFYQHKPGVDYDSYEPSDKPTSTKHRFYFCRNCMSLGLRRTNQQAKGADLECCSSGHYYGFKTALINRAMCGLYNILDCPSHVPIFLGEQRRWAEMENVWG